MRSSQISVYMFRSEQDSFVDMMCRDFKLTSVHLKKGVVTVDLGQFIGKRTVRYLVEENSLGNVYGIGSEGIAIDVSKSPVIEIQRSVLERRDGNIYLRRGRLYANFFFFRDGLFQKKDEALYDLYHSIKRELIRSYTKYNVSGSVVYASNLSVKLIKKKKIIIL